MLPKIYRQKTNDMLLLDKFISGNINGQTKKTSGRGRKRRTQSAI